MWCAADYPATAIAVYNAVWWAATDGNSPPEADAIQCAAALANWLANCPPPAMAEANRRAREIMADDTAAVVAVDGVVRITVGGAAVDWRDANGAAAAGKHAHPLGPVIGAWQEAHPPRVRPKMRGDPIFPARLVMGDESDSRTGRLFSPAAHFDGGGGAQQARLPGLGRGIDAHPPALPLAIYYAGGKPESGSGRVAPVALRLWLEMIFAADLKRGGRGQKFEIEQRDLMRMLYPNGWRGGTGDDSALAAVVQACRAIDAMRIPIDYTDMDGRVYPQGVAWRVVSVDGEPLLRGAPVVARVELPPGSERGPVVDRVALRNYGMKSAPLHRALLNLAFRLHHPGRTSHPVRRGAHYIPVEDPARYGNRLLTADGNPVGAAAAQEIVRLFYPGDTARGSTFRSHLKRAIDGLHRLADDGHARIVDGRIMPPRAKRKPGDGAGGEA